MSFLLKRIDRRFQLLREMADDLSWKSLEALNQGSKGRADDFPAYHALRAIAGPANAHPVWAMDWTSPSGYTYRKGTPAPRWTDEEIHLAMIPQIRIWANKGYGKSRGSGDYRSRGGEGPSYGVSDLEMNMHSRLQEILQRELDQGRILAGGGFVSYVTPLLKGAASKGVHGTADTRNAIGRLSAIVDGEVKRPEQFREIADRVQGEFRTAPSHKKDPGNPYGRFSPEIYQLANRLADAVEAGDREGYLSLRQEAEQLRDRVYDSDTGAYGTDDGRRTIMTPHMGSTPDAKAARDEFIATKISSIDAPASYDNDAAGIQLGDADPRRTEAEAEAMNGEVVLQVLKNARAHYSPSMLARLQRKGMEPLTDGEYRVVLRQLAGVLPSRQYPGKGVPGQDPELDPRTGQPSAWVREGMPWIANEKEAIKSVRDEAVQNSGGGGEELSARLAGLTDVERDYTLLLLGVHPDANGQPLRKADIARMRGITAVNVNNKLKKVLSKLGLRSFDELAPLVVGGGGDQADQGRSRITGSPLKKFQAWMDDYVEEFGLNESVDPIDYALVLECQRLLDRFVFRTLVAPIFLH